MTYLENLLATIFSTEVGLSDECKRLALASIKTNPDTRQFDGIRIEISKLMEIKDADWMSYVEQDHFEVDEIINSQEEAKLFILNNVWIPLYEELARQRI